MNSAGTPIGWIREGSIREDGESDCDTRVRNHFYNPLNNSGYFRGVFQGAPSANWGLEDVVTYSEQDFSYTDARGYLWSSLTSKNDTDRQHFLALTFRSLGQIIHLIQDAAQPQHTRNDSHAGYTCPYTLGLFGPKSLFETYVDHLATTVGLNYGGYPNVELSFPRQYWDDETGRGVTEFSNRNFVSSGTNFLGPPDNLRPAPNFPKPDGTGVQLEKHDIQELMPGSSLNGKMTFVGTPYDDRYTGSSGFNPRTSTYSIFTDDLNRRGLLAHYSLNRFNFDTAQSILIPRAVGYSAGLLDYFFRGRLEISAPDEYAYLVAPYSSGTGQFTKLRLKVKNITKNAETGAGTIQAVVRYRKGQFYDPILYPATPGWTLTAPLYAFSAVQQGVTPTREPQELVFDLGGDPIPVSIADVSVTVIFRGPLIGADYTENDAIVFGGKDVYEPELIDLENSTDFDCYQSTLYNVVGRPTDQRDLDGDGVWDLYGPDQGSALYLRFFPYGGPIWVPAAEDYNFTLPEYPWTHYGTVVAVQDGDAYTFAYAMSSLTDTSTGDSSPFAAAWSAYGQINRIVDTDAGQIHEVRAYASATSRGVFAPQHVVLVNHNTYINDACFTAIRDQSPVTEIPGSAF